MNSEVIQQLGSLNIDNHQDDVKWSCVHVKTFLTCI